MALTLEQVTFLRQRLGVPMPLDYVENKQREADFRKRRAQIEDEHPDLKEHHLADAIRRTLRESDELAKTGTKFAEALKKLEEAQQMIELPPPPTERLPEVPVKDEPPPPLKPVPPSSDEDFDSGDDDKRLNSIAKGKREKDDEEAEIQEWEFLEKMMQKLRGPFGEAINKLATRDRRRLELEEAQERLASAIGKRTGETDLISEELKRHKQAILAVLSGETIPEDSKETGKPVAVQEREDTKEDVKGKDVQPKDVPLPRNPLDAVHSLLKSARAAQETIRLGAEQLLAIQGRYLTIQDKRGSVTNPSEEFNKLTAEMSQAIEEFKAVNVRSDQALAELQRLEQALKTVVVDDLETPVAAVKLHAKATTELSDRVKKAVTARDQGAEAQVALLKAFNEKVNFTARGGVKLYEPDVFELPSILTDLTGKIQRIAQQFRDAQEILRPLAQTAEEWVAIIAKGRSLPGGTADKVAKLEQDAKAASKDFSKWNAEVIKPWRGLDMQVKSLKKEEHPETVELFRRCITEYDIFSREFDVAGRLDQQITNSVKLLNEALTGAPVSNEEVNQALRLKIEAIQGDYNRLEKPVSQLGEKVKSVPAKKKRFAQLNATQIVPLEEALVEVNRDIQTMETNLTSLELASQAAGSVEGLIKSRFSGKGVDKKLVTRLKTEAGRVQKVSGPALLNGRKALSEMVALRDQLLKKRAGLGKAASVEDTVRLQGVLKELPPLPGKDTLLPAKGVSKWKAQLSKGGDKKSAKLFAEVTKAWELAEKKTDHDSLDKLDRAAALFLKNYQQIVAASVGDSGMTATDSEDVDAKRAAKCREAQRVVRKMRLKLDRDALPEPPWTEAQASKAKQIEAGTLLENGAPAKAPSAKGESDSFFINNGEGKPAFIFKPKQGENVKEDLGGREGEGVVREVLTSKFNDQMKEMIGVDFGVSPTGIARLESDSFGNGEKSKEKSRVGALQQAIPNEGSLLDKLADDPGFAKSVKKEDVQKVALMDFLTLQGDRNAGNLLVQEVNGEKRMVPIDGGFAFPSKGLFVAASAGMGGAPMDVNAPPPTDEEGRMKAKGSLEGKNALMLLPQSQEKFSEEMLKSIEALDPNALVKGLKKATTEIGESAPEVGGLVEDENLENVRRSAVFLKKAAPLFTVAELGEIYAIDFKRILEVPAKQVDKEIAAVIKQGRARADFNKSVKEGEEEYSKLGGDTELVKLGWNPKLDRMLRLNLKRRIEILKKGEKAPPPAKPEDTQPKPPSDEESLLRELKELGGDKELQQVLQRPDGNKPKLPANPTPIMKVGRLRGWKEYNTLGGDKVFKKIVGLFQENQYEPFGDLPKETQAAVAAFGNWSGDPYDLGLGGKLDALRDFHKFRK